MVALCCTRVLVVQVATEVVLGGHLETWIIHSRKDKEVRSCRIEPCPMLDAHTSLLPPCQLICCWHTCHLHVDLHSCSERILMQSIF
jgi:hypothetical protein